jgi:hypothetical protein
MESELILPGLVKGFPKKLAQVVLELPVVHVY